MNHRLPPPRKRFGQHFLTDANTVRKIVGLTGISPGERILEIGPGRGVLTRLLLDSGALVTAVEIDHKLCGLLRETFAEEIAGGKLILLETDVLKLKPFPPETDTPSKILANLPYNITTHFLEKLCDNVGNIAFAVLMLQRDAVDRLLVGVGEERWGWPNFRLRWEFSPEFCFPVGRKVFTPPPHVDSAVIRLLPRADKPIVANEPRFLRMIATSFHQRRRMLRQTMKPMIPESVIDTLNQTHPEWMTRRGETLDENEWLVFYRLLVELLDA